MRAAAPLLIAGGIGPYLVDHAGRRYLDATAGHGYAILGYGDSRIVEAIAGQLSVPVAAASLGCPAAAVGLADQLGRHLPVGLDTVVFANSSHGDRAATELARHVHAQLGRHERTFVLDLRARPTPPGGAAPDDLQSLRDLAEQCGPGTIAAIVLDPVNARTAAPYRPEVLRGVRELCDEFGALLVFDESRIAPGRTGAMLTPDFYGVRPDILVLGSGLTAGYVALGVLALSHEVARVLKHSPGDHLTPHLVYPAACAAAAAVFRALEADALTEKAMDDGALLREGLRGLAGTSATGAARGVGLLAALDLLDPTSGQSAPPQITDAVVEEARRRGVLLHAVDGSLLFAPPYTCSGAEIDLIVETTAEAVAAVYPAAGI